MSSKTRENEDGYTLQDTPTLLKKNICSKSVGNSDSMEKSDAAYNRYESGSTYQRLIGACGELKFSSVLRRTSHFLRLSSDSSFSDVFRILTEYWGLQTPNLVVSVVGGISQEPVSGWVREVVRQGLVQAAQSTDAWIVTGGLREDVVRCVSEAVMDHRIAAASQSKLVALGVAPWGLVKDREKLNSNINKKESNQEGCSEGSLMVRYQVPCRQQDSNHLDSNHQAFLLVDDGSSSCQDGQVNFITNLEKNLSSPISGGYTIPVLCLLISGSESVLKRMNMSLSNNTPWLVLNGSGHAANMIKELTSLKDETDSSAFKDEVRNIIKKYFPSVETLKDLVDQAVGICKNKSLITVFDEGQDSPDEFDVFILKALLKGSKQMNSTTKLTLALAYNRADIAKKELFSGDIEWKHDDLIETMTTALENNKPEFVRLLTENGLDIKTYLTYECLDSLYQSLSSITPPNTALKTYLKKKQGSENDVIKLSKVSKLLEKIFGGICKPFYQDPIKMSDKVEYPWASLLIWAVLQNRSEMAIFFWERVGDSVMSALSVCKILRELSKWENKTETQHSMKKLAQRFEDLAHDMFNTCYQSSQTLSHTLLKMKSKLWGEATCLQMATAANARHFLSHDSVQTLLSQIWWGDMDPQTETWKLIMAFFLPPLIFTRFLTFRKEQDRQTEEKLATKTDVEKASIADQKQAQKGKWAKCSNVLCCSGQQWTKYWQAPVTSFLGNVLMYFLFLVLFAYILLVEFKPPPPIGPAPFEYFLYFWVFTLACEEIRQMFFIGSGSVSQNIWSYFQNKWNICDLIAIFLFILGVIFRMFHWSYASGRSVLCVDYMVFSLRLIEIFAINKHLGPKIIMIREMVKDIFFFLFFLGVWLLAYGVANQALMYNYDPRPHWVFRRIFYKPYMYIFGYLPLEEIDADLRKPNTLNCTHDMTLILQGAEPCPQSEANWLVLTLLCIYLLITNVLLINLLIAMFNYTFNKVQEENDVHWMFERYNVILEYDSRPCLAPPFIIFSHLRRIIMSIFTIGKTDSSDETNHFISNVNNETREKLRKWQAEQKENLLWRERKKLRESDTEQLRSMMEKVLEYIKTNNKNTNQNKKVEDQYRTATATGTSLNLHSLT